MTLVNMSIRTLGTVCRDTIEEMKLEIGTHKIGGDEPCFIIAEAGSNFHIGADQDVNKERAFRMIDLAANAKADAVKFQLFKAKDLYVMEAGSADYIGDKESIYDIIQARELPYSWLPELKKKCDDLGLIFLCTPFDEAAVDALEELGIQAYKISSYSITHLPFLKYIASKGKPIILSTGASDEKDIIEAIRTIHDQGNKQLALLQCTAKYPAPLETINLNTIPYLKQRFNNIPTGLSDHSREPYIAPLGAVALGADILEKHFTTNNDLPGPDHSFSITDQELVTLVNQIRQLELCLGENNKTVHEAEQELRHFCRHRIYASQDIKKGEKFTKDNLSLLRSGKLERGLEPSEYERLLGQKVGKSIKEGQAITEESLPKFVAIIQVRMGSTRLPDKALRKIAGKELINHVIDRIKLCKKVDQIMVASTTNAKDDVLEKHLGHSVVFYRGSENNLLHRFHGAAKASGATDIVRIWGDCVFVDPEIVDKTITKYQKEGLDYCSNVRPATYPRGLDVEVFSMDSLERMQEKILSLSEKRTKFFQEYMTDLIVQNKIECKKGNLKQIEDLSGLNLCIDYEEDVEFAEQLLQYSKAKTPLLKTILETLRKHPELMNLKKDLDRYQDYEKAKGEVK